MVNAIYETTSVHKAPLSFTHIFYLNAYKNNLACFDHPFVSITLVYIMKTSSSRLCHQCSASIVVNSIEELVFTLLR